MLYADETHVRAYQVLRATWAEVGRQKQVPTYGHHAHHAHVSIFDAVDVQQGEIVLHRVPAANATAFLDFLHMLQEKYPNKFIVLVLDNARIHYAKIVRAFLNEDRNPFHFIFLPPYSSQLNPIE
ncbi:IS630 family transposase [Anoxybacillus sp. ST4]|nr:IS630 family transposase [Anoxybacillus sp. ST4]MBW7650398.1 IS630 family transposase [Anoxybacillus sp. ST4]